MSSIPVPALEAPAEPSSSNLVPVLVAFAIGTAVSIGLGVPGGCTRRQAMRSISRGFPPARQRGQRWQSRWPWPSFRL